MKTYEEKQRIKWTIVSVISAIAGALLAAVLYHKLF